MNYLISLKLHVYVYTQEYTLNMAVPECFLIVLQLKEIHFNPSLVAAMATHALNTSAVHMQVFTRLLSSWHEEEHVVDAGDSKHSNILGKVTQGPGGVHLGQREQVRYYFVVRSNTSPKYISTQVLQNCTNYTTASYNYYNNCM